MNRLLRTSRTVGFDLGSDDHEYPIHNLLQSRWNILRGDNDAIHNGSHRKVIDGDGLSHIGLGTIGDVGDLEILNSDTIDSPEVIPPLKE